MFVYLRQNVLLTEETVQRDLLVAKDNDWVWNQATTLLNNDNWDALNRNLFYSNTSFHDSLRQISPSHRSLYRRHFSQIESKMQRSEMNSGSLHCESSAIWTGWDGKWRKWIISRYWFVFKQPCWIYLCEMSFSFYCAFSNVWCNRICYGPYGGTCQTWLI